MGRTSTAAGQSTLEYVGALAAVATVVALVVVALTPVAPVLADEVCRAVGRLLQSAAQCPEEPDAAVAAVAAVPAGRVRDSLPTSAPRPVGALGSSRTTRSAGSTVVAEPVPSSSPTDEPGDRRQLLFRWKRSTLVNEWLDLTRALPGTVYRGDSRPPEEIFASGFAARGTDYDLSDHLAEQDADTGYISFTGNARTGGSFALRQARQSAATAPLSTACPSGYTTYTVPEAGASVACLKVEWSDRAMARCFAEIRAATQAAAYTCGPNGRLQYLRVGTAYVYSVDTSIAANMLYVPDQTRLSQQDHDANDSEEEWAAVHAVTPAAVTSAKAYTFVWVTDTPTGFIDTGYSSQSSTTIWNPAYRSGADTDTTWQQGSGWAATTDPFPATPACTHNDSCVPAATTPPVELGGAGSTWSCADTWCPVVYPGSEPEF